MSCLVSGCTFSVNTEEAPPPTTVEHVVGETYVGASPLDKRVGRGITSAIARNRAWFGSGPIFQATDVLGAMSTAKELPTGLDAMAYDLAFAMGANRRHRMYRTFKAVKDHRAAVSADELKGLVVVISAYGAFRHAMPRLLQQSSPAVELLAYQSSKN